MSERRGASSPIIDLEWMDQEVRRYRNELIAAQQRINTQDEELREQARHIEDLEGRLASVLTQFNRLNVLERALDQHKEEIRLMLDQHQEGYQQDRREDARIKLIEQDSLSHSLSDLRKGIAPISRLEEELELRVAEDRRLKAGLAGLAVSCYSPVVGGQPTAEACFDQVRIALPSAQPLARAAEPRALGR